MSTRKQRRSQPLQLRPLAPKSPSHPEPAVQHKLQLGYQDTEAPITHMGDAEPQHPATSQSYTLFAPSSHDFTSHAAARSLEYVVDPYTNIDSDRAPSASVNGGLHEGDLASGARIDTSEIVGCSTGHQLYGDFQPLQNRHEQGYYWIPTLHASEDAVIGAHQGLPHLT